MFEDDQIIHKATLILRELSDDEKLKESARIREKRLHDEASELASAREEGREEGREDTIKRMRQRGYTEEQIKDLWAD